MIPYDRRLKTAAELFAGGRLTPASDLAGTLWAEGDGSLELAVLYGELALLGNRLGEAETALRLALEELEGHPRLTALLAETLRRAGRLGEAAALYCRLERRFGFRIGGLVGDGFVRAGCLDLDFANGRVRLSVAEGHS